MLFHFFCFFRAHNTPFWRMYNIFPCIYPKGITVTCVSVTNFINFDPKSGSLTTVTLYVW
jgi:hypothetical protein